MTNGKLKGLMAELKEILFNNFLRVAQQRVTELEQIIKEAQDAANNETKSSAGDKHETGRAMAQLETEKLTKQLTEAIKLTDTLAQINPEQTHKTIGLGSLVITSNGNFFISASLGKTKIEDQIYYAISTFSPIGKLLSNKKEKESFSFNGKNYMIKEVY